MRLISDNNGWISVEKCPPAYGYVVLLLLESNEGHAVFDLGGRYNDGKDAWIISNDWNEGSERYTVKFWRPLPPPPDCYEEVNYEL